MSFSFGSNSLSGAATAKPSFSFGGTNTVSTSSAGFGFGTTTSTGFGTTPSTGFGATPSTGFGATPSAGFGANTSTGFGANQSTGFGANPSTGFGATPSTGFGATQSTGFGANPSTGFGAATSTGFGATNPTGFGGFGAAAATAATPFGGLGATPATTAPSLFGGTGFGNTAAKPATGFGAGFGTNTFGTGTGFGANTSFATSAPSFGTTAPAFGTNTLGGTNTFGTTNFGAGSTLGGAFGAKPAATGFGGFGAGLGQTNQFGQPQQQQQQQQGPANATEALVAAVFNCCVFGDERDQVLAKWNLLQAQWGTGQAYYNRNAAPLDLNEQNPLCRFKTVGYSKLGGKEEKDGHVTMIFNKTEQDIKNNQQALITSLQSLLGNKPNLVVTVDSVKAIADTKSQVIIYVVDKNAGNSHVAAGELSTFLNNGAARNALAGAGCVAVTPCSAPAQHALQHYLATPPPGMDARLWKQAQADNPDPENYIPVPMIGFSEVKFRAKCQAEQARLQAEWLKRTGEELGELRSRREASTARITQLSAGLHRLRHTLLQVVARQEVMGRVGAALTPDEEAARARMHELASQLSAPPLYNGRLNELLCAVRLQRSADSGATVERYHLDPGAQEDVKQFLTLQQRGMAHLLDTARKDLAALNTIAEGMSKLVRA